MQPELTIPDVCTVETRRRGRWLWAKSFHKMQPVGTTAKGRVGICPACLHSGFGKGALAPLAPRHSRVPGTEPCRCIGDQGGWRGRVSVYGNHESRASRQPSHGGHSGCLRGGHVLFAPSRSPYYPSNQGPRDSLPVGSTSRTRGSSGPGVPSSRRKRLFCLFARR